jgi:uncharacterized repeat protein (TIGR01451 family)
MNATEPEMVISKDANVSDADPGDTIDYTLTYENIGSGLATNVIIVDTIDPQTTFVSATPFPNSIVGDVLTWNIGDVAPNTVSIITIIVEVDAGTPDQSVLTNVVTLSYSDANGNPYPEEEDSVDVIVTAPIMTLSKVADVTFADPGDIITYTITYSNIGTGEATNVVIMDTIPEYTAFFSSNPAYTSVSGNTYWWYVGSVQPGSTGVITIQVIVDVGTADQTLLHNEVNLDYNDANGNPYPTLTDYANVFVTAPIMTLSKTADVTTAEPGDLITYSIEYANIGTGDATFVIIWDTIPNDTTFVSSNPAYDSVSGDTYRWNIPTVPSGTSGTIIIIVMVDLGTPNRTLLTNYVTLSYCDANGNFIENLTDSADVMVTVPVPTTGEIHGMKWHDLDADGVKDAGEPGLPNWTIFIDYDWDGILDPGEPFTYTDQKGNYVIVGISPGNYSVDEVHQPGWTQTYPNSGNHVVYIGPGDIVKDLDFGNIWNASGQIEGMKWYDLNGDGIKGPGESGLPNWTIFIDYDWDGILDPGEPFTYTDQNGNYVITGISPGNYSVDEEHQPGWTQTYPNSGNHVVYVGPGDIITGLDFGNTMNATEPNMIFTKSADVNTTNPGDIIVYTLTYENIGTGVAFDVTIEDTIPDHATLVSTNPVYDVASGKTYTWYIGNVAPGSSGTITITVSVDVGTEDETVLLNTAILHYSDSNGNPYPDQTDDASVIVTAPDMSVSKTTTNILVNPGDYIEYVLEYWNNGTGWASNVVFEDTIDPQTTYDSASPTPDNVAGDVITWNLGNVAPGTHEAIYFWAIVDPGTIDGTILTNSVTLDYTDANSNPYPQDSSSSIAVVTAPYFSLFKTANVTTAEPGDLISYLIQYTNWGLGWATGVVIEDLIPENTTFVSSSPPYDSNVGNLYVWNIGDVDSGEGGTITIIVEVNADAPEDTNLENCAYIEYYDFLGYYAGNATAYAYVLIPGPPNMHFNKTADVSEADPGDIYTYTINYWNSGTGTAYDVIIVDMLPDETTFISSSPAYTSKLGNDYTWDIGTVLPGTSGTITIVVQVNVGTPDQTEIYNYFTMYWIDDDNNTYGLGLDSGPVIVTAPVMYINKTANVDFAFPGEMIIYTIEYENSGTGYASNVVIEDTLDPGTTFVSATPTPTSVGGNVLIWNIGSVAPGSLGSITIVVTVNPLTPVGTILTNYVTLSYSDANGNFIETIDAYANVTVSAPPEMIIRKTAVETHGNPGDIIHYIIDYENIGTGDAVDVTITDTIPDYTTFHSSSPSYDYVSGKTYTWIIGDVAAGASGTLLINVSVNLGTPDEEILHNEVTLDYNNANGNPYPQETDFADVIVSAPIITFSKSSDVTTADPGDTIIYTLEYENLGTGGAYDVVIVDTIDPDTTFISATPSPDLITINTYTWDIGYVPGGSSGTITVTVQVNVGTPDGTALLNSATIDYKDANDNDYPQLEDSVTVIVTAPIMTLSKTANVAYANPGDTIIYTLEYENLGSGWAALVEIVDTIPAATTFISSTPAYTSSSADTYTWYIGNVAPGSSGTITITVAVDAGTADMTLLHNTASIDYADANGNYYNQETDFADVTVTAPVMSFSKSADVSTADPGDTITYTLYYENSGTGLASLVEVVDNIPGYTTFVSSSPGYSSVSGDTYTWYIGNVGPASTGTITITVTVDAGTPDEELLHNTATIDYADANGNYYNQLSDYADVMVTTPIMYFSKSVDVSEADPGDTIIYTLYYENMGTGWASLVEVVDTIPQYTTFVSSSPAFTSFSGDTYTWVIGDVGPGTSGTITIIVSVDTGTADETILGNEAFIEYADVNGNYYPQEYDSADVIVTAPIMFINKTADRVTVSPGETIIYTITYWNSGTGWATDVTIEDTLDPNTTFVGASPTPTSVNGDVLTWDIGDVGPGSVGYIYINVTVDNGTQNGTIITNTVTLSYSDANGNFIETLMASVEVEVIII